jgi:hypothetical protein
VRGDGKKTNLKRTDTTLDLSQKAKRAKEEKMEEDGGWGRVYIEFSLGTLVVT